MGRRQAAANSAQSTAQSALGGEKKEGALSAEDFANLQHEVTDLKAVSANTVEGLQDTQKRVSDLESPLAIHYKGITITPGGFIAAETVWRPHATISDVNTPFNSIPFSAAGQARFSEFYAVGRQSRLSLLAQGKWGTTNLTGYYETDFLGAGVTSNNNQSNSYVLAPTPNLGPGGLPQRLDRHWRSDVELGDGNQERPRQPHRSYPAADRRAVYRPASVGHVSTASA